MWTGAGRRAVVIDETQMRTRTASIILFARVGGCGGERERRGSGGWDERTEGNIEGKKRSLNKQAEIRTANWMKTFAA